MSVVEELIRKDDKGTLSFGNYLLSTKTKKSDFQFEGASYKIKTFKEITRLEKNGVLVYESVPGSAVSMRSNKGRPSSSTRHGMLPYHVLRHPRLRQIVYARLLSTPDRSTSELLRTL